MEWDYYLSGFHILSYWQTYAAITGYLLILFVPVVAFCLIKGKKQNSDFGFKCITNLLIPFLQAVAVTLFVFTLFPIMFGLSENISWRLPWKIISLFPAKFTGLLGVLIVMAVAFSFIPGLGRLHLFKTVILGALTLMFVQMVLGYLNPTIDIAIVDLIPGYWFIAGIIVMTALLSLAGHYFARVAVAAAGRKLEIREGIGELVALPIVSAFGFVPVFIYAGWLA